MLRIYFVTGVAVYEISCPNTSLQAKAFVHEISCTAHALRGDGEIRTLDPLLARQVLSQLSYTPILRQPPALPYRLQYSTIGRLSLNHRVRDENGCVP